MSVFLKAARGPLLPFFSPFPLPSPPCVHMSAQDLFECGVMSKVCNLKTTPAHSISQRHPKFRCLNGVSLSKFARILLEMLTFIVSLTAGVRLNLSFVEILLIELFG